MKSNFAIDSAQCGCVIFDLKKGPIFMSFSSYFKFSVIGIDERENHYWTTIDCDSSEILRQDTSSSSFDETLSKANCINMAVESVNSGELRVSEASRKFKVPKTTLLRHLSGKIKYRQGKLIKDSIFKEDKTHTFSRILTIMFC